MWFLKSVSDMAILIAMNNTEPFPWQLLRQAAKR